MGYPKDKEDSETTGDGESAAAKEARDAHQAAQDLSYVTRPSHVHYSRLTPKLKFLYQERATQE